MSKVARFAGMALLAHLVLPSSGWSVEVGERMPEFGVESFAGSRISDQTLAGKPALIVFWNTWCSSCLRELPKVSRAAEKLSPRGLAVVAINTGLNDSESKARSYWQKHGYLVPAGFDRSFEVGRSFRVAGVPTVLLIDSKGIVRYKDSALPENMEERLRQLGAK